MSEDRKFINVCLATGENLIAELASKEDVEKLPVQLDTNNVQLKNVAIILRKDIQSPMMLLPWIDHIERDGVVSISVDKINWYCPVNDEFVEQYEKAVTKWYSNLVMPDPATTQKLTLNKE